MMQSEQGKRVLVIDDDPEIRKILGVALRRNSLQVDEAAGGREALELLQRNRYGVVLLDLMMPEVDGFQILDGLSSLTDGAMPVVLLVTGVDDETLRRIDIGRVHGIIRKPFDPIELGEMVRECVEIRNNRGLGAICVATVLAGTQLLALFSGRIA